MMNLNVSVLWRGCMDTTAGNVLSDKVGTYLFLKNYVFVY